MEDLNPYASADSALTDQGDSTDTLSTVIRTLVAKRDLVRENSDPDELLSEIREKHVTAFLRSGNALAIKACRRMIVSYLKQSAGMSDDDDGRQIAIPGLERLSTHVMFPVPIAGTTRLKVVARHTRDATLEQHEACLTLKQTNTARCVASEGQQQRVIDLLKDSRCDTLREWESRFGTRSE